jgi:DNA-directed RNA polymerase specialized sigma24 family protein
MDSATEKIYRVLCDGFRLYIARKLGNGHSEDQHEVLVIAEQAIREGNLRDQRLMGYLRTVVRSRVAARIQEIIQRRQHVDAGELNREKRDMADRVLRSLAPRDQEILTRFYLREQSADQICAEMGLPEDQYWLFKSRAMQRFAVPTAA